MKINFKKTTAATPAIDWKVKAMNNFIDGTFTGAGVFVGQCLASAALGAVKGIVNGVANATSGAIKGVKAKKAIPAPAPSDPDEENEEE